MQTKQRLASIAPSTSDRSVYRSRELRTSRSPYDTGTDTDADYGRARRLPG